MNIVLKFTFSVFAFCFLINTNAQLTSICDNADPAINAWKMGDGVTTMKYYTDINDAGCNTNPNIVDSGVETDVQAVYYNSDYVWVETTGCPSHMTGPYNGDGNPSFPNDQARTIVIPRTPTANPGSSTNDYSRLGPIGYAVNGVAFYNASDNMTYNNQGVWYRNAVFFENEGFGCDRTHPANDDLHYHQTPIPFNYNNTATQNPDVCDCFPSNALFTPSTTAHSPIIGFALDGYPIYGPYAFTNTDGTGGVALMTPSYQTRNITTRTTLPDGSTATSTGPAISATYPLGAFWQDYEYVAGSGTLDYYNGRFAVTPEYPQGTYAYFATMDVNGDAVFPYFVGLEFYGELVDCDGNTGGGGPGSPPDCSQVPAGQPCCGDGICGGPETADNCPADCGGGGGTTTDCDLDATAINYANSGSTTTCTNTVNAGIDSVIDCLTGQATLTGSGNTGTGSAYSYQWHTNDGNIISGATTQTATVDAEGTYYFFVYDENGFYFFDEVVVGACVGGLTYSASVKVLFEGYTNATSGLMHTDLNTQGLIPNAQPFNQEPWNYSGIETLASIPSDMTDWILVVMRDASGNILNQKACYVNISGQVYDMNGNADISFPNMSGNYISVHPRHHLAVLISEPITGQMLYDLPSDLSLASGIEQMKIVGSNYTLYAGEYCANGVENNLDFNVWTSDASAVLQYLPQDGDGNGVVNNLDFNLWTNNRSKVGEPTIQYSGADCTLNNTIPPTSGLHPAFNEFDTESFNIYLSDDDVVLETDGLPNHTSPYWSNTTARSSVDPQGNTITTPAAAVNHPLFVAPTVTTYVDMAPGNIDDFNGMYTLTVPQEPQLATNSSATGLGAIGFAVSGAVIYNDEEGPNVPLDNAVVSLDYTAAHTGPQSYHYHLEPKAWSDDDGELIGIISDGFFLYGRRDYDGSYPTDLDASGGHFGPTIHNPSGEYHYHIQNELFLNQYYILFPGDYQGTPNSIQ